MLRKKTRVNYKTGSDIWRHEIHLEIFIDLIEFCLKKGFSLDQCIESCLYVQELLKYIKKPTSSLHSTLDIFVESLEQFSSHLNDKHLKEFIDYMNFTLFTHFNLYKYVFNFDREDKVAIENKTLHRPSREVCETNRLSETKPFSIWDYEQKVFELDKKESNFKEKFKKENEKILSEEVMAKNLIEYIQNDAYGNEKPLDEEVFYFKIISF